MRKHLTLQQCLVWHLGQRKWTSLICSDLVATTGRKRRSSGGFPFPTPTQLLSVFFFHPIDRGTLFWDTTSLSPSHVSYRKYVCVGTQDDHHNAPPEWLDVFFFLFGWVCVFCMMRGIVAWKSFSNEEIFRIFHQAENEALWWNVAWIRMSVGPVKNWINAYLNLQRS